MENKICKLYKDNNSLSDISKELKISKSKVYRILKKNNINTNKNSSNYIKKLYKYNIDDTFFEKINTEEKAYILGFLYADGNLHKKYYHIKLKLQERDKCILEKMNKIMKSNKPIYFHKKLKDTHQNQVSIVVSNKKMYSDLINLGLYPNKTYDLMFKQVFKDKFFSHFLRGYFDGDGCICVYESKERYFAKKQNKEIIYKREVGEVSFTGTKFMINYLNNYFLEELNIKPYLRKHRKCHNELIVEIKIKSKDGVKKFYDFLYKDANIFLERKKDKFKTLNYII